MRTFKKFGMLTVVTALLAAASLLGQDKDQDKEKDKDKNTSSQVVYGTVDFGVRYATGDVYGRPDLRDGQCLGCGSAFDPSLKTSKFNEYRDVRNGPYLRRLELHVDNVLNSNNYFLLKSEKTLYRDQSYLGSFGQYGKFKIQFRYSEIPHTYTDTARTLYTQSSLGVWSYPTLIRQSLQAATAATLPNIINTQVVPQSNFITPAILRKGGTALAVYNLNANWSVNGSFFRESIKGTRPIGLIMNSSPSASATSGFGVELPEILNYFNNLAQVGVEYGRRRWGFQAGYIGSFFQNSTPSMTWDNPFRLNAASITNPTQGRMSLYPDNRADYLTFAAATNLSRYLHFTVSISPGWQRQDQAFLPYTINPTITTCGGGGTTSCTSLTALPASNLNGEKQTLAMNYNAVTTVWKSFELKANYRQYDYNNNTPILNLTPVQGDAAAPTADQNTAFGFNRKNLELTGEWFFAKKSSVKGGYEAEWMDRNDRDVAHSLENSYFGKVDWVPFKDLLFRVSYRHSDRKPDVYQDDQASDPASGAEVACSDTADISFTADQRCSRRFDEAARLLNRGDALIQYSPTDKLTVSAYAGTLQNDYNRPGGTNSPAPLNFLTGGAATTQPYYLYGVQKDISTNYGFDVDYAFSTQITFFAEYSHEHDYKRIISRYRTPTSGVQTILTCAGCDSANNDWESTTREPVDISAAGVDMYFGKKAYLTTYYSLSASKANVGSNPLGDPTTLTGANQFLLIGTNAAVSYPETVARMHDVAVIFKYKITENLVPRIEYHYQQWDNKDYQTSPMTQYMGCVSAPPPAAPIAGCASPILSSATSPTPTPGVVSPFYPYFVVGDPSAARYLFLGADQPSYHAHTLTATLEYRF